MKKKISCLNQSADKVYQSRTMRFVPQHILRANVHNKEEAVMKKKISFLNKSADKVYQSRTMRLIHQRILPRLLLKDYYLRSSDWTNRKAA